MTLVAGTRLGPYEVVSQIGVGGMGEVYRATDTNLKRQVAIKVLPASVAGDAERLARFQREAEVLASLNHPNIAQIHGLEKSGGMTALVMELVEGPTLADRIATGAIPIDEALPIAKQVAEALEAAHEQGIIHRDLKPANIKVRPDGTVKVLDFGLAKALGPAEAGHYVPDRGVQLRSDISQAPTITSPALMTGAGMILGTAAYMSPEQARGTTLDKRVDLWAFGVVLWEMLTGKRLFEGATVSDTLAAVLRAEPDWTTLPATTPALIRTLLRRCLAKDRKRRLDSATAARLEIEDALTAPAAEAGAHVKVSPRGLPVRVAVVLGLATFAGALAIGGWLRPSQIPGELLGAARVALPLSPGTELGEGASVVISPDGTQVAYVASEGGVARLYLRSMNDFEGRPIADTQGAVAPFFSPDGLWLGFFVGGTLKKVSTTGGVVVALSEEANTGPTGGAAWGPNDTIVFRGQTGLVEIPADGGAARALLTPEQLRAEGPVSSPEFLPGGEALLVTSNRSGGARPDARSIDVLSLATGDRKVLIQGGNSARYLPTGHLLFLRDGAGMAVSFDLNRLELVGTPVEVLTGIRQQWGGVGAFSCSHAGSCVYVAGGTVDRRTVALVDRTGSSRPLPLPPKSYVQPRFSPAGDRVSFWIEQLRCDIEVYDIARSAVTRLLSEGDNHSPIWTPDGQRIAYASGGRPSSSGYALFSQLANGGGSEEQLAKTQPDLEPAPPMSWSARGVLALADRGDIWLLPRSGEGEPTPFAPSQFNETMPAFSPDGQWLAYVSDESGRFEIYVRPFPGPGEKYPISTAGGSEPVWARNGRELFFRNGEQMMVVDVGRQTDFRASRPRLLFTGTYERSATRANYDVAPDGETFVMLNSGDDARAATQINVLINWFEELTRLVPTN